MVPLSHILIGEEGIFKSQSELAREVSRVSPQDYPEAKGVRALINQVCSGKRKVPKELRQAIMRLLNGKPDHFVSSVNKEIDNHNKIIVPMMRKAEPNVRASCTKHSVQERLCRALVTSRFRTIFREKPLGIAMATFKSECLEADPLINNGWEDLFSELLMEMIRENK